MKLAICDLLGIDFPIVAFSHCRDVVAEVSRAGGCGVLGAALMTPEELDVELDWIDERVKGRPYGIDLIVPNNVGGRGADGGGPDAVPPAVREFVDEILRAHDIEPSSVEPTPTASEESLSEDFARGMLDVAFQHPLALIANALGTPPPSMLAGARAAGVPVGALVGTAAHAEAQVAAGVDFVVAQGSEAGGHTGQVATMVLVPEVVEVVRSVRDLPVLAAGGIVTGRQIAAAIALGAAGVWTGSVWLTTAEAETAPYTKQRMLAARSSDTVRSRFRTGKPSRQLRSEWHDAWERDGSPAALPMPLMGYVTEPPLKRADVLAASGHEGARRLATYWVGQGVGLLHSVRPVRQVIADMVDEYLSAVEMLNRSLEEQSTVDTP